jgi:hypothetical protein
MGDSASGIAPASAGGGTPTLAIEAQQLSAEVLTKPIEMATMPAIVARAAQAH